MDGRSRSLATAAVACACLGCGLLLIGLDHRRQSSPEAVADRAARLVDRGEPPRLPPLAPSLPSRAGLPAPTPGASGGPSPAEQARSLHDRALERLALSAAEQEEVGRDFHADVLRSHAAVGGADLRRVERLGRPIAARFGRDHHYRYTVLADGEVNAFSHVGGYIYVNAGLLRFVNSEEELQFIVGHEIGHVALGHCARIATVPYRVQAQTGRGGAQVAGTVYQVLTAGYGREDEFAADAFGRDSLVALGVSRQVPIDAMRHLARLERPKPRANTPDERVAQRLGAHLASHPPTSERIARLGG